MTTAAGPAGDYAACRTLGHAWDWIPVPRSEPPPGAGSVWLWLRCTRCTTERHDVVSTFTGEVGGRRYSYPDGYSRSGLDVMARDDWRKQYLKLVSASRPSRRRGLRPAS